MVVSKGEDGVASDFARRTFVFLLQFIFLSDILISFIQ